MPAPEDLWCDCEHFVFWYFAADALVCQCGHSQHDHINEAGLCMGKVEISHG